MVRNRKINKMIGAFLILVNSGLFTFLSVTFAAWLWYPHRLVEYPAWGIAAMMVLGAGWLYTGNNLREIFRGDFE